MSSFEPPTAWFEKCIVWIVDGTTFLEVLEHESLSYRRGLPRD